MNTEDEVEAALHYELVKQNPKEQQALLPFYVAIEKDDYHAIKKLMQDENNKNFALERTPTLLGSAITVGAITCAKYIYYILMEFTDAVTKTRDSIIQYASDVEWDLNKINTFFDNMKIMLGFQAFYKDLAVAVKLINRLSSMEPGQMNNRQVKILENNINILIKIVSDVKKQIEKIKKDFPSENFPIEKKILGSIYINGLFFLAQGFICQANHCVSRDTKYQLCLRAKENIDELISYEPSEKYKEDKDSIDELVSTYDPNNSEADIEQKALDLDAPKKSNFISQLQDIRKLAKIQKYESALNKIQRLSRNRNNQYSESEMLRLKACKIKINIQSGLSSACESILRNDYKKLKEISEQTSILCEEFIQSYNIPKLKKDFNRAMLEDIISAVQCNIMLLTEVSLVFLASDLDTVKDYAEKARDLCALMKNKIFASLTGIFECEIIAWPSLDQNFKVSPNFYCRYNDCVKSLENTKSWLDNIIKTAESNIQVKEEQLKKQQNKMARRQKEADECREKFLEQLDAERTRKEQDKGEKRGGGQNRNSKKNIDEENKQQQKNIFSQESVEKKSIKTDPLKKLYDLYQQGDLLGIIKEGKDLLLKELSYSERMIVNYILGETYIEQYSSNQIKSTTLLTDARAKLDESIACAMQGIEYNRDDPGQLEEFQGRLSLARLQMSHIDELEKEQKEKKNNNRRRRRRRQRNRKRKNNSNANKPAEEKDQNSNRTKEKSVDLLYELKPAEMPPAMKKVDIKVTPFAAFVDGALRNHGFSSYLVGGAVRDSLLGLKVNDEDLVTNALDEEIIKAIKDYASKNRKFSQIEMETRNKKHPIIVIKCGGQEIEISTFPNDTPDAIRRADAKTRDYTINAIYYDIAAKKAYSYFHDGFSGFDDLTRGIIRMIGEPAEKIQEDPMRITRGIRIGIKLGFELDNKLQKAINDNKKHLAIADPGHRWSELDKTFLQSGKSLEAFLAFKDYNLLPYFFSGLATIVDGINIQPQDEQAIKKMLVEYDDKLYQDRHGKPSVALFFAVMLRPLLEKKLMDIISKQQMTEHDMLNAYNEALERQSICTFLTPDLKNNIKLTWSKCYSRGEFVLPKITTQTQYFQPMQPCFLPRWQIFCNMPTSGYLHNPCQLQPVPIPTVDLRM